MSKISSDDMKKILSRKLDNNHSVFTETNLGPSRGGVGRVDVIAVENTWSPPCVKIVEIKVDRSDFLNDRKWSQYKDYCHEFYWACPTGLISRSEVGEKCGLMMVNPDTHSCTTVKKAIYRTPPAEKAFLALYYLLTWRYGSVEGVNREQTVKQIRREMEENRSVGEQYARYVSEQLDEAARMVDRYRRQANKAERVAENAQREKKATEKRCREANKLAGVVLDHNPRMNAEEMEAMLDAIPYSMPVLLERTRKKLQKLENVLGHNSSDKRKEL